MHQSHQTSACPAWKTALPHPQRSLPHGQGPRTASEQGHITIITAQILQFHQKTGTLSTTEFVVAEYMQHSSRGMLLPPPPTFPLFLNLSPNKRTPQSTGSAWRWSGSGPASSMQRNWRACRKWQRPSCTPRYHPAYRTTTYGLEALLFPELNPLLAALHRLIDSS